MSTPLLFTPITIRGVTLPNRIVLSPLCMYTADKGVATPFHFSHLSTFARGRVGLVMAEATAVEARGRITPKDLGIWTDEQAKALRPIVEFVRAFGSVPGIQLGHAGRKASTRPPGCARPGQQVTEADAEEFGEGPWETIAPSAIRQSDQHPAPREMTQADMDQVREAFVSAAVRAVDVGFGVIELHMAHGYLLSTFLSPASNQRTDQYGGSFENRIRFPMEVINAVRAVIPASMPLFVRLSAIDSSSEETSQWSMDDTVEFSKRMLAAGVDVVDCSSGGITGAPRFRAADSGKPLDRSANREPGFQVPYARRVKQEVPGMLSMAVGVITDPDQAEEILTSESADLVALGRELMYNPFWPLHAAAHFGIDPTHQMWPPQYAWAITRRQQILALNKN
jgi:2,4-dienoyl-CoA reductase-like NADH-dependent reductase (Old Yellow Enzyme family)